MSARRENQKPESLQHEADREKPRHKGSALGYITILFAAAILLLLLSYLMQQRNNEEAISGLKESVSALQTVENLQSENAALNTQVDDLEEKLAEKDDELTQARRNSDKLGNQVCAMDWLREIQALYAKKYYTRARAMIEEFKGTELAGYLPDYPLHTYDGSDVLSPLEQYNQIVDALG